MRSLLKYLIVTHQIFVYGGINMKDTIIFRKADSHDNFHEMARLLYQTDPYIYPYWKKGEGAFATFLEPWMNVEGFIFSYRNFYIAHEVRDRFPLAIAVVLDNKSCRGFNHDILAERAKDPHTDFIIEHYLRDIVDAVQALPDEVAYGVALCVNPRVRGRHLGFGLFTHCISILKHRGIDTLCFDCLKDNVKARALYDKCGFTEVDEGIGFDGTLNSKVEIVTYAASF